MRALHRRGKKRLKSTSNRLPTPGTIKKRPATAPSKPDFGTEDEVRVMLSKVLGTMQAPISGFVSVLAGTLRKVVTALDAIAKKKSGN